MMFHYMGQQYTCVGQNIVVNTFDTYVTGAIGTHMPGKTDKDVEAIYFNGQRTTFIPMKLSTPFPNLVVLNVEQSGLASINQTTFKGQTQLKFIQLNGNLIEYVPRKTFYGLTNLEWLGLASNKIRFLYSDMLQGLTELKRFSASGNPIEVIGSSFFRDNTKLELVYFQKTKLRMIGSNLVRLLTGLKIANFDGNLCTNINLQMDSDINNKLTKEFAEKCAVDCSKAFNTAFGTIAELTRDNLKLNRQMMSNKMEKQSMQFICGNLNEDY